MKIEALWILTNLATGTSDEIDLMLGHQTCLQTKFEYDCSQSILSLIDKCFREVKQDATLMVNLLWLCHNVVSTGAFYANEILMETAFLEAIDQYFT